MSDLAINQGADFFVRFQVKDSTDTIVDLTGYTAKSEIRDVAGGVLIGTFTAVTGTNGYIDLTMEDAITNALAAGSYVYDIFIMNATTGDVQRVNSGNVSVSARITL